MNKSSTNIANTITAISSTSMTNTTKNIHSNKDKKTVTQDYQVVTPKSPNYLNRVDITDVFVSPHSSRQKKDMLNVFSIGSSFSVTPGTDNTNNQFVIAFSRDSENIERLKYETVKNELLDKLNLHILLSFKKRDKLKKELDRVHSQVVLLRKLHDDKQLLNRIEKFKQVEIKNTKDLLKSSVTFLDNPKNSHSNSPSYTPFQSTPNHHYQTRSKSHGNLLDDSFWKNCIDNPILTSKSNRRGQKNSNKHNTSCCYSNISDSTQKEFSINHQVQTIGQSQIKKGHIEEYNHHTVFKRYDGILVLLTCSICGRQGFIAPQGIAIHLRTKHHKTYPNQKMAVLMNQWLLPDHLQDKEILTKFKCLNIDPKVTYFPLENNDTNKSGLNKNKPRQKSLTYLTKNVSKLSSDDNKNLNSNPKNDISNFETEKYKTNHLEKFYDKNELRNLVEIVETSKKDMEVILQSQTDSEGDEIVEYNEDGDNNVETDTLNDGKKLDNADDVDYESLESPLSSIYSSSMKDMSVDRSSMELNSVSSTTVTATRRNLMKRKYNNIGSSWEDGESVVRSWKERLRPAEKKTRPDMIALTELPEHERRSSHYNLRARSKLKSTTIDDGFYSI